MSRLDWKTHLVAWESATEGRVYALIVSQWILGVVRDDCIELIKELLFALVGMFDGCTLVNGLNWTDVLLGLVFGLVQNEAGHLFLFALEHMVECTQELIELLWRAVLVVLQDRVVVAI